MTGVYTFIGNGSVDMYGYLYENKFNSTVPAFNLLIHNDDGGGSLKFRLQYDLKADQTYILIATTYSSKKVGQFSVGGSGPGNTIDYEIIYVSLTTTTNTTTASEY
jgi:hypothetical protein